MMNPGSRERVLEKLRVMLTELTFTEPVSGGQTQFAIVSRKLSHFSDVDAGDRPCAFVTCFSESTVYSAQNLPVYQKMSVKIFVYTNADGESPDSDINIILDSVEQMLSPGEGEQRQTLGGTVEHCRVDGEIVRVPGDMDGDGLILIPVSVATTV